MHRNLFQDRCICTYIHMYKIYFYVLVNHDYQDKYNWSREYFLYGMCVLVMELPGYTPETKTWWPQGKS